MTNTIEKGKWYSYKELCKIAKNYNVTGRSLCDVMSNGKKASGAYGCNILNKLSIF